jgi:CRISPR/Cas system CSM-associated protein Csm3 (group 7 of RAMP superfamily)
MTDKALIGTIIAQAAQNYATPMLIASDALPQIAVRTEAEAAIDRVVKQSAPLHSERVWAGVFAALTAVLAAPEVLDILGPWAPVVTALLSAVLAGWSKFSDQRPTR